MESCLLLGVFHSRKFNDRVAGTDPNRGQGFRDGVRSKALEETGYIVKSLDNKHSEDVKLGEEIHCTANFADARRMSKALKSSFGDDIVFDHIILDYFFSPVGWARERWTANFWRNTLPMLAENDILKVGGKLWLPNLDCVQCSLDDFKSEIERYYVIEKVEDPMLNPLFAATENVEKELLSCPDSLTNETQIRPLMIYSKTPFLALSRRERPLVHCVTPSKDRSPIAREGTPSKHSLVKALIKDESDLTSTRRSLEKELKPKRKTSATPKRDFKEEIKGEKGISSPMKRSAVSPMR